MTYQIRPYELSIENLLKIRAGRVVGLSGASGECPRGIVANGEVAITRRASECDDAVVLGAAAAPDPGPVAPRVKALELYASDVAQRFVMDVCRRAREADLFAARSRPGPGDERFEVPKDEPLERNFAPHIARLVLFLMRIAALQSEGADGGLPGGLPPLEQPQLLPAVEAFVSESAGDMPDEWVGFCTDTARPPAIEVRMQRLRDLRKEPEALAGKLHAIFSLLYITKWRLIYRPSSSHLLARSSRPRSLKPLYKGIVNVSSLGKAFPPRNSEKVTMDARGKEQSSSAKEVRWGAQGAPPRAATRRFQSASSMS